MPNIGFFEIPADDIDRARNFYQSLLGWRIEPNREMDPAVAAAMQYQDVITGDAEQGTLNVGGMYKRQASEPFLNHVIVDDVDAVLAKVERLGGKIILPKTEIQSVGLDAIIQDTEGNSIGIWKPATR